MTVDLAITGGTVVSPHERRRAHVYVDRGKIVAVSDEARPARRTTDATGLLLLPGMVDSHVHLMDPGDTDREDFPTGTRAAAARGVTTIVEHSHAHPIRTVDDLSAKIAHLAGRSNVDFGLAAHTWPDHMADLAPLWEAGITYFKIFTCTTHGVPGLDEETLRGAMARIAAFGGTCLIHCEDESITAEAERRLRAEGRTDGGVITEWRSRRAEEAAVEVVAALAAKTGVRATVAHVSNPTVAAIIQGARDVGADLAAEACPQYFALREDEVIEWEALRKFTPPARARSSADEAAMWELVRRGVLTHFSTDHAPSTRAQKLAGDIWEAPFGLPGLDTTLPFLLDAAHRREITHEDVVRLYSEAPARRYGLYPRKGHLGPGADADIIMVDESEWTVADDDIISKAGWSPYAGRTFVGGVAATMLRGELIATEGIAADQRSGGFLPGPGSL
jgi:dihydroorotase